MQGILNLYERQTKYHTYASSILFTYDVKGVRKFLNDESSHEELEKCVNVKLIDFAHSFPAVEGKRDENFIRGITNLIKVFQDELDRIEEDNDPIK